MFQQVITVTPNPALDIHVTANNWKQAAVNLGHSLDTQTGGKGINVAVNLAAIYPLFHANQKHTIHVSGWLGTNNQKAFVETFKIHKLHDNFIRIPGETRSNIKITDNILKQTTDINLAGLHINTLAYQTLNQQFTEAKPNQIYVLSGSLPKGIDSNFYVNSIQTLNQKHIYTVVDTSGEALKQIIEKKSFPKVLKPNIDELQAIAKQPLITNEAIINYTQSWFKNGLAMLAVSKGDQGALFITPNQVVSTLSPKIELASTVGAGDTMVAAIVMSLLNNDKLEILAKQATAIAAASVESVKLGIFDQQRVDELITKTIVNPE